MNICDYTFIEIMGHLKVSDYENLGILTTL